MLKAIKSKIPLDTKKRYWELRTSFLNIFRRARKNRIKRKKRKSREKELRLIRKSREKERKIIRKTREKERKGRRKSAIYMRGRVVTLFSPAAWIKLLGRIKREAFTQKEINLRNSKYRADYLEKLLPILDMMPVSNGSKYYEKFSISIAIIADEFLFDAYKDMADFQYITPDNYRDYINKVDFLLVASAWRGLHNEWRLMATEGTENNRIVHECIEAYKSAGKTVVFYSKEDPPNYEHFLPIAKKCDVIFTSCVEKVEDYKLDCKTDNVHVMEFCINPVFHNPIGICNDYRTDGVFFAGSWMIKYPERIIALEKMLDGVLETDNELIIADRNFSQNNLTYFFPRKYYPYIVKEIPHDYLQKVHKLYSWAININSITDSETMFANRVYELQANGVLMLSNYSVGVEKKFPEVIIVNKKQQVKQVLNKYSHEEMYEHQIAGVRRVMTGETNYDRICSLLEILHFQVERTSRSILVVADYVTEKVRTMFESQSLENKELISFEELDKEEYYKYDMVARWNSQDQYDRYYLEDMANGFKYTACDYITKESYYMRDSLVRGREHDYVTCISNPDATIVWSASVPYETFKLLDAGMSLENGYSIDHFNYVQG